MSIGAAGIEVEFTGTSVGAVTAIDRVKAGMAGLRGEAVSSSSAMSSVSSGFGRAASTAKSLALNILALGGAFAAVRVIKSAVSDAENYNAALRSLDVAIKNTGGSVAAYSGKVAKLADSGAKLGFSNTDVLAGLKQLTLVSGNATDAVKYMGLAEDLARGKGIDLGAAATAIGKALDGKTTALQRYGVVAVKGESIEELLAQAGLRWQGQAVANTTVTEQLSKTWTDFNTHLGQALLPTIGKVSTATEAWIGKEKNQKTVTDDVTKATDDVVGAFKDARSIIEKVDGVTGGFTNTLKVLVGIKIASWAYGVGSALASIGGEAAVATGEVATLEATLAGLTGAAAAIGLVGAGALAYEFTSSKDQSQHVTPVQGQTDSHVYQSGGKWYLQQPTANRGPSRPIEISAARAQALTGGAAMPPPSPHGLGVTSGGTPNVGDLVPHPHMLLSSLAGGPGGAPGGGAGAGTKGKKAPAYKIPDVLEAEIRKAQQAFADHITEQHLDVVTGLEKQEETLLKQHGELAKAASVGNEITKATETFQKNLVKQQATAAKAAITAIEQQTVGPAQALKLAQAAGQPATVILADEQSVLAAYKSEAATLKSKLAAASASTKALYRSALQKAQAAVASTEDSIVSSLQNLVSTAQSAVGTAWSSVTSDITAEFDKQTQDYITNVLGPQFRQGLQTPSESKLAGMQAQDTVDNLNATLAAATTPEARAAAQRAIDENNLSIQATAERAAADKAYAQAVQTYTDQRTVEEHKLTMALDVFGTGLQNGTVNINDLGTLLATYGIPNMVGLSDVSAQLYKLDFPLLSGAVQTLIPLLVQLAAILAAMNGSKPPGTTPPPGSTADQAVSPSGEIQIARPGHPLYLAGGGTLRVPGTYVGRDSIPALLSPGETVIDRRLTAMLEQGGAGGNVFHLHSPTFLGATERQVGAALERMVTPAAKRVVSYPAPRL